MTAVHVLPTSFPQQRFWVLDQINPGAAAYTMPGALRLRGRLDQRALEQALNAVVSRHEALRTVFALEQDVPVQVVRPSLRVELPLEDLTALPPASREARIQEALGGFANRPFDLAQGPLLAAALLRLGPEDHVFLLVLHHIVADGWSMGVLYREIQQAYQALTAGREPAFAPLPLQYPDFAVWQRKMAERGKFAGDVSFWREALRAPLPVLDLPTDRPRPPLQTFPGASRSLVLSPGLTESIRALSRQEQATPFMTLLAAFQVLLHRYSGQPEIVVGCITSGRERAEVQALIGLFLNTVAVRTDLSVDPSFRTLLGAVRETALGAYQHAAVPFEMVLEALEQEWDRSRNPVFQAGFQMLEGLGDELRLGGLAVERLASPKETAKLDLTLMVMPTAEGGLRTTLEFNTDLFEAETVDRMLAHYRTLLEGIVATPDTAVSTLPLMQADERARVLESWNRTAGAFPDATLPALISAQAARTPGAPAVSSVGTTLSYAELERRSAALAATLLARGVRRGDLVGLCLDRSADLVVGLLGILKTGAAYVPLDPEYPVDRIAYVLEDAGAAVTVSTTPLLAKLGAHAAGAIALDRDVRWTADAPALPCGNPDDLAYVIYTSGSTGRPKGVVTPYRGLTNMWLNHRDEIFDPTVAAVGGRRL
ncbi:MAG TPA: condensation domain-containing protein, partial [Gemmatimonadales bacterium]|nr:condensation domain-containing protein [Gemmatimonadales bacterium]